MEKFPFDYYMLKTVDCGPIQKPQVNEKIINKNSIIRDVILQFVRLP